MFTYYVNVKHVNQVIKGVASITQDTAIRLERVTGVPARMWNSLEANYRERLARLDERSRLRGGLDWLKTIPVKELIQRGHRSDQGKVWEEVERLLATASAMPWHKADPVGEGDEYRASQGDDVYASALTLDSQPQKDK